MAHRPVRRPMKATRILLFTVLSAPALLVAGPAAAVDCFEGNRAFGEQRLDDAIDMFRAALTLPDCRDDRIGLQLNLAVALGKRAANTADHCRAAELFEAVNRSTAGTARERVLVKWRIERHHCAVARALDADDVRVAVGELRRFVDTTDPTEHPELDNARERSQRRLASLSETRVGEVSIQCPAGGRVSIDGLEDTRACPARWQDVPAGAHRAGWIDATGAMRTETIEVGAGRLNAFVFAPAATPSPATAADRLPVASDVGASTAAGERSNTTAWAVTIGAAVLAVGGGAALLAALDAESDREQARADIEAAQALGDREADRAAQTRYEDAQTRALALGYSGYGALALGAALGATAIWLWSDDGMPTVSVMPGEARLGLTVRF